MNFLVHELPCPDSTSNFLIESLNSYHIIFLLLSMISKTVHNLASFYQIFSFGLVKYLS